MRKILFSFLSLIHQPLEGASCIHQAKSQPQELEEAKGSDDGFIMNGSKGCMEIW
jgi:hypothetical protein